MKFKLVVFDLAGTTVPFCVEPATRAAYAFGHDVRTVRMQGEYQ